MLPYEVNGLPLHILLVHVVVVVLPAAALMTVLGTVWPALRRKLGVLTPIVALIGLVSVPLATSAGEWLEARVNPTPLIQAHVAVGDTLLPWAVGLFVVATAIWAWYRWFADVRPAAKRSAAADPSVTRSNDPFAEGFAAPPATPGVRPTPPSRGRASRTASLVVSIVAIVAALVVGGGTVAKVVQIGESGANAVWQGSYSSDPVGG